MLGSKWQNSNFLFVNEEGGAMHPDSLTGWLDKFAKANNLPHINPHAFRHTMASLLYFNGVDSVTISKRLGHAKVSTTSDIYSHIIKQADEQSAECIANAIFRPKGIKKESV
jgi:site-specific recombinase XerD